MVDTAGTLVMAGSLTRCAAMVSAPASKPTWTTSCTHDGVFDLDAYGVGAVSGRLERGSKAAAPWAS
jgi:hypothetical protein